MIERGDKAPSFQLPASRGRTVRLADYAGRMLLLYFYPKADTSGCTAQACALEEALPSLQTLGLDVVGVSPDPIIAIDKFATKYDLSFPLASDADHALADRYGTWVSKSMYGKQYMGMERSSFLIGPDGTVRTVWRKVKPAEHAALVRKAIETGS